jgi:hypothetical protein
MLLYMHTCIHTWIHHPYMDSHMQYIPDVQTGRRVGRQAGGQAGRRPHLLNRLFVIEAPMPFARVLAAKVRVLRLLPTACGLLLLRRQPLPHRRSLFVESTGRSVTW